MAGLAFEFIYQSLKLFEPSAFLSIVSAVEFKICKHFQEVFHCNHLKNIFFTTFFEYSSETISVPMKKIYTHQGET